MRTKRSKLISLSILLLITLSLIPLLLRKDPRRFKTEASFKELLTLRSAIAKFEERYGHSPNAQIPEELQATYPPQNRTDANYILGQALDQKIIPAGQLRYAYISSAGGKQLRKISYRLPVIIGPMVPDGTTFDPKPMNGKGIHLKADGSITHHRIRSDGRSKLKKGITLLDYGLKTMWEDNKPMIHYPLPYKAESAKPLLLTRNKNAILFILLTTPVVAFWLILKIRETLKMPATK